MKIHFRQQQFAEMMEKVHETRAFSEKPHPAQRFILAEMALIYKLAATYNLVFCPLPAAVSAAADVHQVGSDTQLL